MTYMQCMILALILDSGGKKKVRTFWATIDELDGSNVNA